MKKIFILCCLALSQIVIRAQKIDYSIVDKEDFREMNFEIIGKVGGNISVYKNYKNRHDISVYDMEMQLKNRVRLEFMPERTSNVDFIAYPDHAYMIYQYQKRGTVYCSMVKVNGEGRIMTDPVDLDTAQVFGSNASKVYSVINSDDKKKIVLFKIRRQTDRLYQITAHLFDNNMNLLRKSTFRLISADRDPIFTDFVVDNDGDFVFGKCSRSGSRESITKFELVYKRSNTDTVRVLPVTLGDKTLDEIKLKFDNSNKRIIVNSFFYKQRKGNIDGLYSMVFDKLSQTVISETETLFSDTIRMDAKGENGTLKTAFNDHFIRNVIPLQDGSYTVISELYYSTSRGNTWNRFDYLYGNSMFFPYDMMYYSPLSRMYGWGWYDPFNRFGQPNMLVRHVAENIIVFYYNAEGQLQWTNTIRKNQFDDNTDAYLSYQLFNTGSEVRFLFNQREKRELLLNSATIDADGKVKRQPTLKNLNRDYDFMPKFGKQIGLRQVVLPCMYKNYICFAKLEF